MFMFTGGSFHSKCEQNREEIKYSSAEVMRPSGAFRVAAAGG